MIRTRSAGAAILLILLAACSMTARDQQASQPAAAAASAAGTTTAVASATGGATAVAETDNLLSFAYSYPTTGVPELDRWLAAQLAEARARSRKEAADGKREMDAGGFPYRRYDYDVRWTLAGRTSQLVSLAQQSSAYTGGAHGNSGTTAQLWDRANRRPVALADLLVSRQAFSAAVQPAVCAALDQQRREKRGPDFATSIDEFTRCPDMNDLSFIPAGEPDAPFTTLTVIADPYVAGPYVEGDYRMRIPLAAQMITTIKPEWRSSFTPTR